MRCNKTKGYNNQQIQVKMTTKTKFTKMHGAGNDYIYVDTTNYPIAAPEKKAIEWSKFHTGIGSDGLILIGNSDKADFSMRIFNADGSEAMMCGNGSRCVGKYVYEYGLTDKTEITLDTLSGIKILKLHVEGKTVTAVTVDMGSPLETGEVHFEDKYPFRSTEYQWEILIWLLSWMILPRLICRKSALNWRIIIFPRQNQCRVCTNCLQRYYTDESMGKRFGNYSSLWDRCLCYRSSSLHQRAYRKKKRYNNGRWYSHH